MENKGFTLIELIIAITILAFTIVGAYSFFYPASHLVSQSPQRIIAAYLAKEGLEITKNLRDNSIIAPGNSFEWTQCREGCQLDYKTGTRVETFADQLMPYTDTPLNISKNGLYGYDEGTITLFKRKVTIAQLAGGANLLKVEVVVSWEDNNTPFTFNTVGYIYNYNSL